MKKIFRKNQIIITTLAVMIAVAGYLNYSGTMLGTDETSTQTESSDATNKEVVSTEAVDQGTTNEQVTDISEEDIFTDTEDPNSEVQADATDSTDSTDKTEKSDTTDSTDKTNSTDTSKTTNATDTKDTTEKADDKEEAQDTSAKADSTDASENGDSSVPGEAVLTSNAVSDVSFIAEAKLTREQVRSKNKEILLEVINNENVTDDQKQAAVDGMLKITDTSEREMAAEVLLEAKGFTDAVVTITDDSADVVINMEEVTDAKRAQIEDVMKRKTGVSAENIVITPIQAEEK